MRILFIVLINAWPNNDFSSIHTSEFSFAFNWNKTDTNPQNGFIRIDCEAILTAIEVTIEIEMALDVYFNIITLYVATTSKARKMKSENNEYFSSGILSFERRVPAKY